jgi:hypothetical protein
MKSYVGTHEGQRCFVEWELTKDGKFSASGEVWNKSGTDINSGGQNIDELVRLFPGNSFLKELAKIHSKYHLNDMISGSPKQMEIIRSTIEPEFEKVKQAYSDAMHNKYAVKAAVLKRLDKIKYNIHLEGRYMLEELINVVLPVLIKKRKDMRVMSTPQGMVPYAMNSQAYRTTRITHKEAEILLYEGSVPEYYTFVVGALKDIGRHRDPDFLIEGKAYKYGTRWLKEELPEEVKTKIKSWKEVPAPEELTPIQKLCEGVDFAVKLVGVRNKDDWEYRLWKFDISGEEFIYKTGMGIEGEPTLEDILPALLSDARLGSLGLEYALDEAAGFGYEGKDALDMADACIETYQKLKAIGLYDEKIAMEV